MRTERDQVRHVAAHRDLHLGHVMRRERELARLNSPTKQNNPGIIGIETSKVIAAM